jgi:small-conductance mechanosensitive channel
MENIMPLISVEAMLKTIAEQQVQIKELREQVTQLELMLKHQNQVNLAQELVDLLSKYPEKLENPIIASIDVH